MGIVDNAPTNHPTIAMDRHLVLFSNSSNDVFPDNTPSDFTTLLEMPLDLDDGQLYEMALEEITFIRTIPGLRNLSYKVGRATVTLKDPTINGIEDFVYQMNNCLNKTQKVLVKFVYSRHTFKVTAEIATNTKVKLSEEWTAILGFSQTTLNKTTEGEYMADFYKGVHNLHVFSDITDTIVFGGATKPYLGSVSIPKNELSTPVVVSRTYDTPMYVKVNRSRIDTIRIFITDDGGHPVQFKAEPVTVRLSLRKQSSQ